MIQEYTKGEMILQGHYIFSSEKPPRLIATVEIMNIGLKGQEANAQRMVDCWNGCKDFENPLEAPRLYEALKGLLSLHDEDCKMLARGIGTATPGGGKILRAILAIKAVEGK